MNTHPPARPEYGALRTPLAQADYELDGGYGGRPACRVRLSCAFDELRARTNIVDARVILLWPDPEPHRDSIVLDDEFTLALDERGRTSEVRMRSRQAGLGSTARTHFERRAEPWLSAMLADARTLWRQVEQMMRLSAQTDDQPDPELTRRPTDPVA